MTHRLVDPHEDGAEGHGHVVDYVVETQQAGSAGKAANPVHGLHPGKLVRRQEGWERWLDRREERGSCGRKNVHVHLKSYPPLELAHQFPSSVLLLSLHLPLCSLDQPDSQRRHPSQKPGSIGSSGSASNAETWRVRSMA